MPAVPPTPSSADFLWGVATSAFQSEGGYDGPGEPQTNWAETQRHGDVATVGAAADFWHRWREDLARCRALGLNAFRLGIEWSRVQPATDSAAQAGDAKTPPAFDFSALDRYAEMVAEARRQQLEPIVSLHHFVHPAWLGPDPWLGADGGAWAVGHFENFVRVAVAHVNSRLVEAHGVAPLKWYLTINEPNMLVFNTYIGRLFPTQAPVTDGYRQVVRAYNGLLSAHVAAYNAVHDVHARHGWPEPAVSMNTFCSDLYWGDKILLDLLAARDFGVPREDIGRHLRAKAEEFRTKLRAARLPLRKDLPFVIGSVVKKILTWIARREFRTARFRALLDRIYASPRTRLLDFLAVDYYDPFVAHLFRLPHWGDLEFKSKSIHAWLMNTVTSKWWDWRVLPAGLSFFCRYYSEDLGRLPVLIAENGLALRCPRDGSDCARRRDQMTRSDFLRVHVREVMRLTADGVPIFGYLHWSLFDNYEWGSYTPRFGLFFLNYRAGTERLVADPAGDRPSETYAALVREARGQIDFIAKAAR
ncbi:MAG: glycoside hydrolase family 1 protein [Verrucomicrobia bacterium]|nr:glycoside hydrolase family 1 protein [Verrucomicrobiota bacterium]